MKTLLKNGFIYDGSGNAPFKGDLLIEDDRIAAVSENINTAADRTINLGGRSVAPGFIDMHSHNDWFATIKEPLPYFEPFIRQGITSFVAGNCGLSSIAFDRGTKHMDKVGGGLFGNDDTSIMYPDAEEFLEAIDHNTPCNMAILAGHCTARASVAGYEGRKLTQDETEEMLTILEKSLKGGAAGISLGLMYEPGIHADTDELKKIAELCIRYDKPLTVHPRAESKVSLAYPELFGRSHLLRALDELAEISKGTDLKLQYSHAIFVGRQTLPDKDEFLRIVKELRESGVRFQFDIYNELQGVSVITVVLPAWYRSMSTSERNSRLTKLKLSVLVKATAKLLGFGFDDITVAYIGPGYEHYEGKTVHQLAKENRMSDLDMYLKLCVESDFNGRVNMGPYTTEEIIHEFEHNELCTYMTDAWVEPHGVQNPVLYDCFPRFLRDSLLGFGDTMPQTVRRMTGASADRFMLKDRGYLKEGCFADITVFDEKELSESVPGQCRSFGIKKVFINGKLVLDDQELDKEALQTSGMAMPVR